MESLEDVLAHYGVRGMKWGVRRFMPQSSPSHPTTQDAVNAKIATQKVKSGGTKTLTTQELQALVLRMNLEQQYARLAPPSRKKQAAAFISDILIQVGKQQATKLASDLAAEAIKKALKK